MKRTAKISIYIICIITFLLIIIFLNQNKIFSQYIKYKINNQYLHKGSWQIDKFKISNWSTKSDTKNSKKTRNISLISSNITLSPKNQNQNRKLKSIVFKNTNFTSQIIYPINSNKLSFSIHSDYLLINSQQLAESPIMMLDKQNIKKNQVKIKDVNIKGFCEKKLQKCEFTNIRLGKNDIIIHGYGESYYKKGQVNLNLTLNFTKLPDLKIPIKIEINKDKIISKIKQLSANQWLQMI